MAAFGRIIDGKTIAGIIRQELKEIVVEMQSTKGITPGLGVILVGNRTDSATYVRMKKKAAAEVGFHSVDIKLPDTATQEEILDSVDKLNKDPNVHGILVQLPLPGHVNESEVLRRIKVEKDVDGLSAENIGNLCERGGKPPLAIPCTPAGCVELLQRSNVDCSGKNAVVIGRSNLVGMPAAHLLLSMDATVTICHSRTKNIKEVVQRADIIIAAVGKAEFVKGDWIKEGAVIIDVGINSVDDSTKKRGYRLVGDVCFDEAKEKASYITPVPGGVGPMTIAMLLRNTINLARYACNLPRLPLRRSRATSDLGEHEREVVHIKNR